MPTVAVEGDSREKSGTMCGRFLASKSPDEVARWFATRNATPNARPRYNVAPSQDVLAVRFDAEAGQRTLDALRWGLVPFWAKDIKIGYSLINAKAETVAEKPAFRDAFTVRRCLIAADGFYEWKKLDAKTRQPYAITMRDRGLFGFAGLWERWKDKASGEIVRSCTIITTTPNEVCAPLHDRMPVIIDPADYGKWLGEEPVDPVHLFGMLRPFPAEQMMSFPVDARVGNVTNDDAALLATVDAPA
jgi:putative SOS response-associated peptidase YedK